MCRSMAEPRWGLLPAQALALLQRREWDNRRRLKARLTGELPFPAKISLRPPKGSAALGELAHFNAFVQAWRDFAPPHAVCWGKTTYRHLGNQPVPTHLVAQDPAMLARLLGPAAEQALQGWQQRISRCLSVAWLQDATLQRSMFALLVSQLEELERLSDNDLELLLALLPQLRPSMGGGAYLRALPLVQVDTKFVEQHQRLIELMLDVLQQGAISDAGGLLSWLNCQANPRGWLWVRPLCESSRAALGGLPLLQLSTDTLLTTALPAGRILVVENVQSGLGLPALDDCIAVFGGGKNLSWLQAEWLQSKQVAYWGDIDSEGLTMLADARSKLQNIEPLLMDQQTLLQHQARMVPEPASVVAEPAALTATEAQLFRDLRAGRFGFARLEQERLAPDWVHAALTAWSE